MGAMAPWGLVAAAWLVLGAVTAHGASPGGPGTLTPAPPRPPAGRLAGEGRLTEARPGGGGRRPQGR